MPGPLVIPIAAAAIGAIASGLGARSARTARKRARSRFKRAQNLVSPGGIASTAKELLPQLRELLVGQFGPQLQQATAAGLARNNLVDTGIGIATKGAAASAPELAAVAEAINRAIAINQLRAQLLTQQALNTPTPVRGGMAALIGGARGFFAAGGGDALSSGVHTPSTTPAIRAPQNRFPTINPNIGIPRDPSLVDIPGFAS